MNASCARWKKLKFFISIIHRRMFKTIVHNNAMLVRLEILSNLIGLKNIVWASSLFQNLFGIFLKCSYFLKWRLFLSIMNVMEAISIYIYILPPISCLTNSLPRTSVQDVTHCQDEYTHLAFWMIIFFCSHIHKCKQVNNLKIYFK